MKNIKNVINNVIKINNIRDIYFKNELTNFFFYTSSLHYFDIALELNKYLINLYDIFETRY
jgi:hypothetical protein